MEERAKLDAKEAVRRGGGNDSTFSRLLVTPHEKALKGLPKELEDRYLELENSLYSSKPPQKYTHAYSRPSYQFFIDSMLDEVAQQLRKEPSSKVNKTTQPTNNDAPPVYGDDALTYLNQYIIPSPAPPAPKLPPTTKARQAAMNTSNIPFSDRTPAEQEVIRANNDRVHAMHAEHMAYLAEKARMIAENPDPDLFGGAGQSKAAHKKIKRAFQEAVQGVVQVAAGIAGGIGGQGEAQMQMGQFPGAQQQEPRFDMAAYEAKRNAEVEREYAAMKKECERLEKQVAGLVRKNRKLAGL
jgi:hypothetical protein